MKIGKYMAKLKKPPAKSAPKAEEKPRNREAQDLTLVNLHALKDKIKRLKGEVQGHEARLRVIEEKLGL